MVSTLPGYEAAPASGSAKQTPGGRASYDHMESATHSDEPTAPAGGLHLRNALRALYADRFAAMARFAAARLGDAAAGEDAVNDAFVIALQHLESVRDPEALESWVWSILLNETRRVNRHRTRRRVQQLTDEAIAAPPVPEIDDDMRRRIRGLPERQRTVLFLKYYGDLTNARIADLLDVAIGTVGATLHQAQAALRRALDHDGDRDG